MFCAYCDFDNTGMGEKCIVCNHRLLGALELHASPSAAAAGAREVSIAPLVTTNPDRSTHTGRQVAPMDHGSD